MVTIMAAVLNYNVKGIVVGVLWYIPLEGKQILILPNLWGYNYCSRCPSDVYLRFLGSPGHALLNKIWIITLAYL